jgi:hypothetical protein
MTHQLTHPNVSINVDIPKDWEDVSYKNDTLPSFEFGDLQIFVGDENSIWKEELTYKYSIILKEQYGFAEPIFESDDWYKVLCFINDYGKDKL